LFVDKCKNFEGQENIFCKLRRLNCYYLLQQYAGFCAAGMDRPESCMAVFLSEEVAALWI